MSDRRKAVSDLRAAEMKAAMAAAVRATARAALRESESLSDRRFLRMAESGHGVSHLIAAGCSADIARRIVLGVV